jgi:TonB-linked SusC/RagA family outer membrane protein
MTNLNRTVRILVVFLFSLAIGQSGLFAQETGYTLTGKILESGSGMPLQQATVSAGNSGEFASTDIDGAFTLELASSVEKIVVNFPGYHTTEFYTNGESDIIKYITRRGQVSSDELYSSPMGGGILRDAVNSVTMVTKSSFENTAASSFDQNLVGRVSGLQMTEHSGMPGHSSWMNMRGVSSIFGRNTPLVFIDGMIHETNYPINSMIEGHMLNPMDLIDLDDIVDVTAIKAGEGNLGSAGSNGVIYINTEQRDETSASILVKAYGGVSMAPQTLDVFGASQFRDYFTSLLNGEGYSAGDISTMYPWLNGGYEEYYRYNNNTDWQADLQKPTSLQKYSLFLKGGDDIATYNISTGFQRHGAPYDQWRYSRYNLRLNGKINITNKFSVIPNTKLALSDSYLSNMGPTTKFNTVTSSLLKSPLMTANERSVDGNTLYPYDDVGAFNMSNPAVLIGNSLGSDRFFQLLTSVKLVYVISPKLSISNVIGTSVNNDRINIFIPQVGVVQEDSVKNSPRDMVTEFRSTQNHLTIKYNTTFSEDRHLDVNAGMRYMANSYKNNSGIDLNTPSDEFRSLGQGVEYPYLRSNGGEVSEMKWISYFTDANYKIQDKYYLRASLSLDASSAFNKENRYNFYPSIFGAWRLSSEEFFSSSSSINDLKLRASYSLTGNMFSSIYQYSKPSYTGRRYNSLGVVVRDYNPNEDLSGEKKSTANIGLDMTFGKRAYNLHLDYYMSYVHNLVINQLLPYNFGFTDYYDNGGVLAMNGIELAADGRINLGQANLILDATVTKQSGKISSLEFINPETEFLTREVFGAEYVAAEGSPLNAFYGYATEGVYDTDADAGGMIGPKGKEMGGGDVAYVDMDDNMIIDERDKQIIGDPNPDLFGSLSATLALKKLQFSALFTYSVGNDIYNYVRYKATSMDSYANQSTDVADRWVAGSTNAALPRAAIGDPSGNNVFSDRWIESGSFLRFKQFMVSYNTSNIFGMQKEATLYITGTNLFTLSSYSGFDPETMYLNDPYFMGIDYGKIPLARSIIFGIKLSL